MLSGLYGRGFSGDVYKTVIENDGANARFKKYLSGWAHQEILTNTQKEKGPVVLVAFGLGWDPHLTPQTPSYVRDFFESLNNAGFQSKILITDPAAPIWDNMRVLEKQVRPYFESGRDVILVGLCKGAPEILAAADHILSPYLDKDRKQTRLPAHFGRLIGYVNLSGMIDGTYLADDMSRIPGFIHLVDWADDHKMLRGKKEYARGLLSISHKSMNTFKAEFLDKLPSDAIYVNIVGVLTGSGKPPRKSVMTPFFKFNLASGANDGFIEYPEAELPHNIAPRMYTVAVHGSHLLTDGFFEDLSLDHKGVRDAFFNGLYGAIINASENGF